MADVAVAPAPVTLGKAPKKAKVASKGGEKKAKKPSTHPPVNDMVVAALNTLKERHGTSLQAVKKYIGANYQCDVTKLSPFIKKSLKSGVAKGALVQTKGTGASGSFKLKVKPKKAALGEKAKAKKKAAGAEKKKVAKKPGKKLPAGVAKPKKAAAKKAKAAPARAGGAKPKKAAGLKQKSTKHSKSVAKKPKAPKPKKASGAAAKKVAKK